MFSLCLLFILLFGLVIFIGGKGPMVMGGMFLLIVFFGCIMLGVFLGVWYGCLVFLVYVGGLLILFSYMCALSINIKDSAYNSSSFLVVSQLCVLLGYLMLVFNYLDFSCISDLMSCSDFIFLNSFNFGVMSVIGASWAVFLACLLFFAMVLVVKVCRIYSGPLRVLSI